MNRVEDLHDSVAIHACNLHPKNTQQILNLKPHMVSRGKLFGRDVMRQKHLPPRRTNKTVLDIFKISAAESCACTCTQAAIPVTPACPTHEWC